MMIGKLVACGVPECLLGLGGGFMIRRAVCLLYKKGCIDTLVSMFRVSMCQCTDTALEGG